MNNRMDHLLFGPYGSEGLLNGSPLKKYGANAVWFHGFDSEAFEACNQLDLAACVEFKTFRADFNKRPHLIPIGMDGKPIRYGNLVQGVCLSDKEFLEETESNLINGLKQFKPHGVWLDYLTYTGWFESAEPDLQESCFCKACVEEFCNDSNIDEQNPVLILKNHAERWKSHKCEKIAGYASHYSELIRFYHPECLIGAYMCPWSPKEYGGALNKIFAQDYNLLAAAAVDIFTPLIYVAKSGRANTWGKEFLESSGSFIPAYKKVQLILDYNDFPESLEAVASSRIPSWGMQIFSGSKIFENPSQADIFRKAVEKIKESVFAMNEAKIADL